MNPAQGVDNRMPGNDLNETPVVNQYTPHSIVGQKKIERIIVDQTDVQDRMGLREQYNKQVF